VDLEVPEETQADLEVQELAVVLVIQVMVAVQVEVVAAQQAATFKV
jgi:hypothetical protein